MNWPEFEALKAQIPLLPGVTLCKLHPDEVPAICEALAQWYPDLGAMEDRELISPTFYDDALAIEQGDRCLATPSCCVFLLKDERGLLGYNLLEYYEFCRSLRSRLMVVNPQAQRRGLARSFAALQRAVGEAIGADHIYALTELDNLPSIRGLEKMGAWLCGILPCSDHKTVDGQLRYVPEAVYVLPLVSAQALHWPTQAGLIFGTAQLMKYLFAERPADFSAPATIPPSAASLLFPKLDGPKNRQGVWPELGPIASQLRLPAGLALAQLERREVPRFLAQLSAWRPSLAVGSHRPWFTLSHLHSTVALANESQRVAERNDYVVLLRFGEQPVACCCISLQKSAFVIDVSIAVVAPELAGQGLEELLLSTAVRLAHMLGAHQILGWASTNDPTLQRAYERVGFTLSAIIPAASRQHSAFGVLKITRVCSGSDFGL